MSQQISPPPTPNRISTLVSKERELSWQIASNLFVSFKYAWAGISYSFQTQRNFRIHLSVCAFAIGLSIFLHLQSVEIAIIAITSGLVLTLELVNTAIESLVDLTVKQTYHDLAKVAKDCAAGAVLVSALVSLLVAATLLLPPLVALIVTAF
ncbi:diacylglycerol kinase family protein [Anabaena cylindrica FACHB-243]|uniref:Diacylglycerol kinase n=1 Tax=Anabaena cylindrica (strain ATCC 27899 / PCC 7122) TaxID=272123 RepID=K9ZNW1_ANACC|nr:MULTISPECIES: diacylglycerol kinase family protein [Anabaena]AFZ60020.1 diacylglycerol kinase [Anabaena cylindrica PCC 7122]MBD2417923.1 diacylglycerol kinase family protein [Anabaena cylindrica FACHB-243]MBY5282496.1 diacylglycerol kinase family protein [Anabaena sp. CCAP 1446/1C]MBY5309923.1 diacylglycerol kinase family protein [Anabaena sp. CCAP 1446/1C]MCM2404839.1 diacylglycerol kinase family protein [Anabaena sp. CCAP 1446/1C]